ncbi:MAG: hypothetical protein QM658_07660 [Gordonia sp. (in: high G+C Gram-positive bacteria)]
MPDDEPSITAWRLVDDDYHLAAVARGDETFAAASPFPLTLRPSELLD